MAAAAVIPARYDSTRLPGKLLLERDGKSILQHTFEQCRATHNVPRTIIATDDERIREAARQFGAEVVMTSPDHPSGSDRVAEVARNLDDDIDVVINVQGDEPEIDPDDLDRLVDALQKHPDASVATLGIALRDAASFQNPNVVKIVTDAEGRALYFSRAPIPATARPDEVPEGALKHVGVYAYRRSALLELAALPPVALETTERLEQLRALHHGHRIQVVRTEHEGIEINTPEDYDRFLKETPR